MQPFRSKGGLRRSTWLPAVLLVYLAVMSWIGRGELADGNYIYYFGIIFISLAVIGLLHVFLKKRENLNDR